MKQFGKLVRRRRRAVTGTFAIIASIAASLVAITVVATPAEAATPGPGPVKAPTASMVRGDALPTAQINGVAWKQVVAGNTVYVGGDFSTARPAGAAPGVDTVTRTDLLSYNIQSGVLTSFAPVLDGQVLNLAVSPDRSRLYAVGDFTTVNGAAHQRIAAFDAATGALITSFNANLNGEARAVVATNSNVYVGGQFGAANNVGRTRLAAFTSTGTLTGWAPTADYNVNDLVLNASGSQVDVAGAFTNLNATAVYGIGAVSASTGATVAFAANRYVKAYGGSASFTSLTSDGAAVYGTAYNYHGSGNLEGMFSANPTSGNINWVENCHGDTYGAFSVNGAVYAVGHPHYCQAIGGWPLYTAPTYRYSVAFTTAATGTMLHDTTGYGDHYGQPSPSLYNWFPDLTPGSYTAARQAAWTVSGNSQYLVEGGEFTAVNGVAQQGLVRFAVAPTAPGALGPVLSGGRLAPTLTTLNPNAVRIAFQADWDRDDMALTYKIVRNGNTANPIWTGTVNSQFWNRPMIGVTDSGLTAGSVYRYKIYASDPDGNTVSGDTVSVTASGTSALNGFDRQVINDGASSYWPLDESSGAIGVDNAAANDIDVGSGVTRGTAGPVSGQTASTFSGTATGFAATRAPIPDPTTVSLSAWVRTTSTSGGEIAGFGNNPSAESFFVDRVLYLDNVGKVHFGVMTDATKESEESASALNDGQWHQVVGTLTPGAMNLWVDGVLVASRTDVVPANPPYSGWWRIGGDDLAGWTAAPTSDFLSGAIGAVAVTPSALTGTQIRAEYEATGRTARAALVTDNFDRTITTGWGSAARGGTWSTLGSRLVYSVRPQTGTQRLSRPTASAEAYTGRVQTNSDVRAEYSLSAVPTGGPVMTSVFARRMSSRNSYFAKVLIYPNGTVAIRAAKLVRGTETTIAGPVTVRALTYRPGLKLSVRARSYGTSPTTVRAKVWNSALAEPSAWQVNQRDSSAGLQYGGTVGVKNYVSARTTNTPITVEFARVQATGRG